MTYQRDPNLPPDQTVREKGRGMLPILLLIAVVLGAGVMLFRNHDQPDATPAPTTQTVPAPSPAPVTPAPTTPKQP
jgi:hypothetical protein